MILLGSCALSKVSPSSLRRVPSDVDLLCTQDELDAWKKSFGITPEASESGNFVANVGDLIFEFEVVRSSHSSEILKALVESDPDTKESTLGLVPSLDILFALKTSHRYRKNSPHFWKTLEDWHLMKAAGAKIRQEHREFISLRSKEVASSVPKLNVTKKDFFKDDQVDYFWDHDSIHVSVAEGKSPAYMSYLSNGEEVMCSKELFDSCTMETKVAGVVEESAVLAIERSLWPHPGKMTESQAWSFAFSKVCTSITSGWFREFAYENAPVILKNRPQGFWNRFVDDVKAGRVKKFNR